jgi:hypothetical protein
MRCQGWRWGFREEGVRREGRGKRKEKGKGKR